MLENEYKLIDKWLDFFINKVQIKNNLIKLSQKKLLIDIDLNELFYKLKINIFNYDKCKSYLIDQLNRKSFETIIEDHSNLIVFVKQDMEQFDLKEYLQNKSIKEKLDMKLIRKEGFFFFLGACVIILFSYLNQDVKLVLFLISFGFFVDSFLALKEWFVLRKYLKSFYILEL